VSAPLEGVLVVALEHAVAAPFATRQLADLGARVIKVERPGGDFARRYDRTVNGGSSYFVWLNRGKESIELDLKSPDDRPLLDAMLARADVCVQNLAPGVATRLRLDAATLRAARPELIHCTISGYGDPGPYAGRKAYDLMMQGEAGLILATGTEESPSKAGISVADIATGMYAHSGILAALLSRQSTGQGAELRVAMIDALAEWMQQPAYYGAYGGGPPLRTGPRHPSIAPYGPFRTADGSEILLGVQNEREWREFCERVLGRPGLATDPRFATNVGRVENRRALAAIIAEVIGQLSAEQATGLLESAGIANARLRRPDELFEHPQLVQRGRVDTVSTPDGPVLALLPPVESSTSTPRMGAVPALGEHSTSLRREFASSGRSDLP
jgi:crotonobetainyl-CoA:carnitine CoA-transferase CaiB-like acyl-CoA transferase